MALLTTSGATQPMKLAVKLKKSYPEAKRHKPLNANGVTDEEIGNWMQVMRILMTRLKNMFGIDLKAEE